jgi:hypothetical protein
VIGREEDQRKNEESVGKLTGSIVEHTLEMQDLYRGREDELRDIVTRAGDLAIGRCWPYPDMYRVCVVTRVNFRGWPSRLEDGAGIRYARDARKRRGITVMPENVLVIPRDRLARPAREIAALYAESRHCGVGQPQHLIDELYSRFEKGD